MQNYDWKGLLLELTKKEVSVRYKKTVFGFLWMFLNPLSQMAILGIVFQKFARLNIQTDNYFLFLFVGLIIWNFFSNTLNTVIPIYVNERSLLQKGNFPREVILLSVVISNLFHFFMSLIVLLAFMTLFLGFTQNIDLIIRMFLYTPLSLLTIFWLGAYAAGIAFLLSSLNVKYRDINFFTSAALPLLFYATPIIWELHYVPKSLLPLLYLNPLTPIIEVNRLVFLNEQINYYPGILIGLISSLVMLIVGYKTFKKESPFFDDWL